MSPSPRRSAEQGRIDVERRLDAVLSEARRNEATWRRFQDFELAIMGCGGCEALFSTLLREARSVFGWDRLTLVLLDRRHEVARLLALSGVRPEQHADLVLAADEAALVALLGPLPSPQLGAYEARRHAMLFPGDPAPPQSVALLPLRRDGRLTGALNIGSRTPGRFRADAATDFLAHMAAVVAVCVEAALARDQLTHLGLSDALTGLENRRSFDHRLAEESARAGRTGAPLACVFIDIDHFKSVNDRYGHVVGDLALRHVAEQIRAHSRTGDVVARYGGEEFALLLADTDAAAAAEVAERIRTGVAGALLTAAGESIALSVSLGVAAFVNHDLAPESFGPRLIEAADRALYAAKRAGRNRVGILAGDASVAASD